MNNALPVLDQTCESGGCNQCGACCTFFDIKAVPSVIGDMHSPSMPKPSGSRCPQLIEENRGGYICALYSDRNKNPHFLPVCNAWRGDCPSNDKKFRTAYEYLQATMVTCLLRPKNTNMIEEVQRYALHNGIPADVIEAVRRNLCSHLQLLDFLKRYLTDYRIFPARIFELLNIPKLFSYFFAQSNGEFHLETVDTSSLEWQQFFQFCSSKLEPELINA